MPSSSLPSSHAYLLEQPNFAHLATVRPDGAPQSSVMWFEWDGERARFTHTTARQKFQNFAHEPRVSFSVADRENPYRFVEVRGEVESIEDDGDGAAFYRSLQDRYGMSYPVTDADVRVIVTIRPTGFVAVDGGMTEAERSSSEQSSTVRSGD
jgi:PPOX class probable F420-dependent enzyme